MNEKQKKLIEQAQRQKERVKRQNEAAKDNWDCVSLKLPKGTKDRIKAQGKTVNGYINELVLAELERLERDKLSEPPF